MVIHLLDHHRSIQFLLSSLINLIGDEPVPCVDTLFIWLGPTPKHTSLLVEAFPIEKAPVHVPRGSLTSLWPEVLSRFPLDRHRLIY